MTNHLRSLNYSLLLLATLTACSPQLKQNPKSLINETVQNNTDMSYFYSPEVKEAEFTIRSHTFFGKTKGVPSEDMIKNDIAGKMRYMMGKMRRSGPSPSAMYPKYTTRTLNINSVSETEYRVDYEVTARGVFKPETSSYDFFIPIMVGALYNKSNGRCTQAIPELVGASNFWYLWDPTLSSCPLQRNVDYIKYTAQLNFLPSTNLTYPEYDRLVRNNNILITVIHGLADYHLPQMSPYKSEDLAAQMYLRQRNDLINKGFSSRIWSENEIRQFYNPTQARLPFVEDYILHTNRGSVTVRMFFGNTNLEFDSAGYHAFLKSTLTQSGIFIYNGHSGLGRNMNLSLIEAQRGYKYNLSPHYQIYFFGSCLPYSYFPDLFFKRKAHALDPQGTKNLDIFSFGNEALVDNSDAYYLVNAATEYMKNGARKSYQQILKGTKFYLSILGDEDNP
jgi:hypothetical protein